VGRRSNRKLGWIVLAAVALLAQAANAATLNKRARLREGPSKETALLGWVEEGTVVTLEGQQRGWYSVRTPDGQKGFVWQEHLHFEPGESAPAVMTVTVPTLAAAPTTLPVPLPTLPLVPPTLPEARPVQADARPAPTERAEGGVMGELERLRGEIARLATAQQEMTQRLGRGGRESAPPPPMGTDGSAGAAVLFFGAGTVFGWLIGRFATGRRERRTRLRL
jgi:uncharacterized protein YgiM (DUF1202 family)